MDATNAKKAPGKAMSQGGEGHVLFRSDWKLRIRLPPDRVRPVAASTVWLKRPPASLLAVALRGRSSAPSAAHHPCRPIRGSIGSRRSARTRGSK